MKISSKHKGRKTISVKRPKTTPYDKSFCENLIEKFELSVCENTLLEAINNAYHVYLAMLQLTEREPRSSETIEIFKDIALTARELENLIQKLSIDEEHMLIDEITLSFDRFQKLKESILDLADNAAFNQLTHEPDRGGQDPKNPPKHYIVSQFLDMLNQYKGKKRIAQYKFIHECLSPLDFYKMYADDPLNETVKKLISNAKKGK